MRRGFARHSARFIENAGASALIAPSCYRDPSATKVNWPRDVRGAAFYCGVPGVAPSGPRLDAGWLDRPGASRRAAPWRGSDSQPAQQSCLAVNPAEPRPGPGRTTPHGLWSLPHGSRTAPRRRGAACKRPCRASLTSRVRYRRPRGAGDMPSPGRGNHLY